MDNEIVPEPSQFSRLKDSVVVLTGMFLSVPLNPLSTFQAHRLMTVQAEQVVLVQLPFVP